MKPIPPPKKWYQDSIIWIAMFINMAPIVLVSILWQNYFAGFFLIMSIMFAIIFDIIAFFQLRQHSHKKVLMTIIISGFILYSCLISYWTS